MSNEQFREHVTGNSFVLTLHKTQIAALIFINEMLGHGEWLSHSDEGPLRIFVTGSRGLQERGLLTHHNPPSVQPNWNDPKRAAWDKKYGVRYRWRITRAGQLTIELLREAGLYQSMLPALDLKPSTIKRKAA